ncbi:MAG: toxin-antitoxin system YwqK family antitoxin [Leadbetterella sp.]
MKIKFILFCSASLFLLLSGNIWGQTTPDVVPKAKTKAQKKAERKNQTLKERIEGTLPVDLSGSSSPILNTNFGKLDSTVSSKKESTLDDAKKFFNETMPSAKNNAKKKLKGVKKKFKKDDFNGKVYNQFPVKKVIAKRGSGLRMVYQEFYILKESIEPSRYTREVYWYSSKTGRIVSALSRDIDESTLLHGPFKEYKGENLVREGSYYMGAKHGRWVEYDKNFNLLNKEIYEKGYYAEDSIYYHNGDSSKLKEVVPFQFGRKSGPYFKFYEDGTLEEEGKYDTGIKVGKWIEYYQGGNRRKKETQYPKDMLDTSEPKILREYDEKGKLIYDYTAKPESKN